MWRNQELETRFAALDELLSRYAWLWKVQPFTTLENPWTKRAPEMATWLDSLSLEDAHRLEQDHEERQRLLETFFPDLAELRELTQAAPHPQQEMSVPATWLLHIKGRKRAQITAFARCVCQKQSPKPTLEWCSGKGHLSRLLSRAQGTRGHCLERDPALVLAGRELANEQGVDVAFSIEDALQERAMERLRDPELHAMALHACGELHRRLMEGCVQQKTAQISVAPCCYARESGPLYRPYSRAGQAAKLRLTKDNLRLATLETVIASPRVTAQRLKNNRYRLAFDCLLRDLTGDQRYRKMRSLSKKFLREDFSSWAKRLATREGLILPEGIDFKAYEEQGRLRQERCSPWELPRFPFRRPLECWLLLDRALFLREHGYRVSLGLFCDKASTPRNFLIKAELPTSN